VEEQLQVTLLQDSAHHLSLLLLWIHTSGM